MRFFQLLSLATVLAFMQGHAGGQQPAKSLPGLGAPGVPPSPTMPAAQPAIKPESEQVRAPAGPVSAAPSGVGAASFVPVGPRFVLGDGYIRLKPGGTDGSTDVVVAGEQLDAATMAAPSASIALEELTQSDARGPTDVEFRLIGERAPGSSSRAWLFAATVSKLPLNVEQVRQARIRVGSYDRVVQYVLTNRYPTPPEFSLDAPARWVFRKSGDDVLGIAVSAGPQAVSGLRLSVSKLVETTTGTSLDASAFQLCDGRETKECATPRTISSLNNHTVYLRANDKAIGHGHFQGTLMFAADGRSELKPLTLEVAVTSRLAMLAGAGLIFLGVLLAWTITVRNRARAAHFQALKPAIAAVERLSVLRTRLDQSVPESLSNELRPLFQRMEDIAAALTEESLDRKGLLPPANPLFYGGTVDPARLNTELKAWEGPIAAVTTIIRNGIEQLLPFWKKSQSKTLREAFRQLADAAATAPDESAARAAISTVLDALKAKMATEAAGLLDAARPRLTTASINSEIERLNTFGWCVYLALVWVTGMALLILRNPGFGVPLDYVYCFIWGFGLPISTVELAKMTPASVSASLSVRLPTP